MLLLLLAGSRNFGPPPPTPTKVFGRANVQSRQKATVQVKKKPE
jgi:hypothetical protein